MVVVELQPWPTYRILLILQINDWVPSYEKYLKVLASWHLFKWITQKTSTVHCDSSSIDKLSSPRLFSLSLSLSCDSAPVDTAKYLSIGNQPILLCITLNSEIIRVCIQDYLFTKMIEEHNPKRSRSIGQNDILIEFRRELSIQPGATVSFQKINVYFASFLDYQLVFLPLISQ